MIEGITIGVIGSTVFALLAFIFKNWVWPWYLSARYEGSKISGDWAVYYGSSEEPSASLHLSQIGYKVEGSSTVVRDTQGKTVERSYKYKGKFLSKSLVLTFEDENNPLLMGGAMAFFIANSDATCMKGTTIYYKPEINDVVKLDAELRKKVPSANK